MGFNAKYFWLGLVLLVAAMAGSLSAQDTDITVLVYNAAHVDRSTLSAAEREAGRIFRAAGVPVTWVECPSESADGKRICGQSLSAREFVLRIVGHGKTQTDSVFGVAFLDEGGLGKYCDLFLDRVKALQQRGEFDSGVLLGAVAAHEIGHLLLGTHSHSAFGLMAPRWQLQELKHIAMHIASFDSAQAARMRSRILDLREPGRIPQLTSRTPID